MKNILSKILIGTCLLISMPSCSDSFLEEKRDYNNMTTIDVFSDKSQANAVFAVIYKQILDRYKSPLCGADPLMRQEQNTGGKQYNLSDEIPGQVNGDGRYNGTNSKNSKAGNHIANPPYWNDPRNSSKNFNNFSRRTLFPTIYRINEFIKQIEVSRDLINDEVFWNNLKGQAIFTRAWLYFDAIRLWGGVPYYSTENDEPQMGDRSQRMSIEDCINKICADFETAAGLLPANWSNLNSDYGRFTSVAAWAMISRVRVYAASPVFNASWDDTNSKRWQLALEASLKAEQEARAAGYIGVQNIDEWDQAFFSNMGSNISSNPEAIITILMSNATMDGAIYNNWETKIRPGVVLGSSASGMRVSESMLRKFPMKNGKPATEENGYDDEKFYRNRDPRFYKTFAFSGCQWPGSDTQIWLYTYKYSEREGDMYRYTDGSQGDGGAQKKSRALVWKMSNDAVKVGGEQTSGTDIMEYRFAEILLNIAECYAAQNNTGQCISYLKQIRNRVGAGTDDLDELSGKYNLIKAVLNERAVELAYEGKRPWDMRRWLLYEGGAGFDPQMAGFNSDTYEYDPELAYGAGWKLYNGKNGRPTYTKTDNVLTRLGLERFSGTKQKTKIWGYDLANVHNMDVTGDDGTFQHPLQDNALLMNVTPITRNMNESERNAAFDRLEAFYKGVGMETFDPIEKMGDRYGMDSGDTKTAKNWLFSWRGWYYVYPIHYDMYDSGKGNDWLTQTEGWMVANANPVGSIEEQDGTYVYCTPEQ